MVYWITGRAGSGKTTLANRIASQVRFGVVIDGDDYRRKMGIVGFTPEDRLAHLTNMTESAILYEAMGNVVIIACISPKRAEREKFQSRFKECIEIYLRGGIMWEGTHYEEPED